MTLLKDHVVLIVGGGSGLGLGLVHHFRAEGAQIAVFDLSQRKLDALAAEAPEVLCLAGDVTALADLEAARAAIAARFGRLDAVVCTQGIFDGHRPLDTIAPAELPRLFSEVFGVNVLGSMLVARVFGSMLQAAGGALVLTASTAAFAADGGGAVYTASKGALVSLVRQLAFEFAPSVRVNGVAPAGIAGSELAGPRTLGLDGELQSDIPKDAFLRVFQAVSLLQELPTGEDHGPLYAFLASHQNRIMTGQTVVVDQGMFNRPALSAGFARARD